MRGPQRLQLAGILIALVAGTACPPKNPPSYVEYQAVSAGGSHTCALARSGSVYCWGNNANGQLGDGSMNASNKPRPVSGTRTYSKVSTGSTSSCAISQGTIYCWGRNENGEVGNGAAPGSAAVTVPTSVTMPAGVSFTDVAVGGSFACAVANNAAIYCWGQNVVGKLGLGATVPIGGFGPPSASNSVTVPTKVASQRLFARVAAHSDNACALGTSTEVFCWGSNLFKQLGTTTTETCAFIGGSFSCSTSPIQVGSGTGDGLTVGMDFACYTNSYDLYCWGGNATEQLAPKGSTLAVCQFANGMSFECSATPFKLPRPSAAGTTLAYVDVAAGDGWLCTSVYPIGNSVMCWGDNDHGQTGDGQTTDHGNPKPLATPLGSLSLSGGGAHTCLVTDGTNAYRVYCWGSNVSGQIGNGKTGADEPSPQLVVEP